MKVNKNNFACHTPISQWFFCHIKYYFKFY